MEKLIAIVDDEEDLRELVSISLKKAGYKTKEFASGKEILRYLKKSKPDLIILDIMMPEIDGIEVCKTIRKDDSYAGIPIIMLTAKSEEMDKIIGLEIGADDYVTKPFSPRELDARVKAVLRRPSAKEETNTLMISGIEIDFHKHSASVKGADADLTATEFKILTLLAKKPGWVLSREQLLDTLWGDEKFVIDRTIDVHIRHLREKLGKAGECIKNVRGVGYKIEP